MGGLQVTQFAQVLKDRPDRQCLLTAGKQLEEEVQANKVEALCRAQGPQEAHGFGAGAAVGSNVVDQGTEEVALTEGIPPERYQAHKVRTPYGAQDMQEVGVVGFKKANGGHAIDAGQRLEDGVD